MEFLNFETVFCKHPRRMLRNNFRIYSSHMVLLIFFWTVLTVSSVDCHVFKKPNPSLAMRTIDVSRNAHDQYKKNRCKWSVKLGFSECQKIFNQHSFYKAYIRRLEVFFLHSRVN